MRTLNIAILDCVPASFSHVDDGITDAEKFAQLLTPSDRLASELNATFRFTRYHVAENDFPADISTYDGVLITGSPSSVNDPDAWKDKLANLIHDMHETKQKLIGVCFGHQIIAQTLGGEVAAVEDGWMIGRYSVEIDKPHEWMQPVKTSTEIYHFNSERVTALPDGAISFAHMGAYPQFGYTIGNHILSIQGHPEQPCRAMLRFLDEVSAHEANPTEFKQTYRPLITDATPDSTTWTAWMLRFYLS